MDASNGNGIPADSACNGPAEETDHDDGAAEGRPIRIAPPHGASILYSLSALSILYGMAQLIGPVLARSGVLAETVPCIGALNLYELALLGVLLLIVLWRNVTDDAVSLVVLIGLFLIASGIALDTVANDDPNVAAAVAVACMGLAGLKLHALSRGVSLPLTGLLLAACAVVLAWNVLTAPAMAYLVRRGLDGAAHLRLAWLVGWLAVFAGAGLMLAHAAGTPTGQARNAHRIAPFLKTPAMAWVFASILFVGVAVHQYALAYIFDVPVSPADWLPCLALAVLIVLEVLRGYGVTPEPYQVALACVPLVGTLAAVSGGLFDLVPPPGVAWFWHPPVWLGLAGAGLAWHCLRNGRRLLWCAVLAYGLAAVATAGPVPTGLTALNWDACGLALVLVLLAGGLLWRNPAMLMAAVLLAAAGVVRAEMVAQWAQEWGRLGRPAVCAVTAGLGTMLVYIAFPRSLPRWVAIGGALLLALGAVYFGETGPGLRPAFAVGVGTALTAAVVWLRTRDVAAALILCGPLFWAAYRGAQAAAAWRYVGLSFVLLGAGAAYSLRPGRPSHHLPAASRH